MIIALRLQDMPVKITNRIVIQTESVIQICDYQGMAGPCCTGSSDLTVPPQPSKSAENRIAVTIAFIMIVNP